MPADRESMLRQFLEPFKLEHKRGIEIGPYDRPFFSRSDCPGIEYADVFSTEELRKHAISNPKRDPAKVVSVDYVLREKRLQDVAPSQSMDFVFCSHVLEHVPDLIGELRGIETILRPGGVFLCAFPDRRYTFDVDRAPTAIETFVKRHRDCIRRPEPEVVYDFFINFRPVMVGRLWQNLPDAKGLHRYDEAHAAAKAKKAESEYVDVHCNVLCDEEFAEFISHLQRLNLLALELVALRPCTAPFNEFFFALRKMK